MLLSFADDSNLFLSNKNNRVLEDNANSALIEVSEWLNIINFH